MRDSGPIKRKTPSPSRIGAALLLCFACAALAPCVRGGSLYVSNQFTTVSAYNSTTGAFQTNIGTFSNPIGLTINGNSLYVADIGTNQVDAVSLTNGMQSVFAAPTGASGVYDVAFDTVGNAYITADGSSMVYKYNSSGVYQGDVSVPDARGIAYDPVTGDLYVVSTPNSDGNGGTDAIEELSTSLGIISSTFITGTNISAPRFIAIDSSGDLYISNTGSGSSGGFISEFNSSGVFQSDFASSLGGPNEVVLSSGGMPLYVTQWYDDNVLDCTAANTCSALISQGSGAGTLGLALGPSVATPEPATFGLIGAGLIALALVRRRRR